MFSFPLSFFHWSSKTTREKTSRRGILPVCLRYCGISWTKISRGKIRSGKYPAIQELLADCFSRDALGLMANIRFQSAFNLLSVILMWKEKKEIQRFCICSKTQSDEQSSFRRSSSSMFSRQKMAKRAVQIEEILYCIWFLTQSWYKTNGIWPSSCVSYHQ